MQITAQMTPTSAWSTDACLCKGAQPFGGPAKNGCHLAQKRKETPGTQKHRLWLAIMVLSIASSGTLGYPHPNGERSQGCSHKGSQGRLLSKRCQGGGHCLAKYLPFFKASQASAMRFLSLCSLSVVTLASALNTQLCASRQQSCDNPRPIILIKEPYLQSMHNMPL